MIQSMKTSDKEYLDNELDKLVALVTVIKNSVNNSIQEKTLEILVLLVRVTVVLLKHFIG